jgi:hypothetical protein
VSCASAGACPCVTTVRANPARRSAGRSRRRRTCACSPGRHRSRGRATSVVTSRAWHSGEPPHELEPR